MRDTLDRISQSDNWNQTTWRNCFAGNAAVLAGAEWVSSPISENSDLVYPPDVEHLLVNAVSARRFAAEALGFPTTSYIPLFDGTLTLRDIDVLVKQYETADQLVDA